MPDLHADRFVFHDFDGAFDLIGRQLPATPARPRRQIGAAYQPVAQKSVELRLGDQTDDTRLATPVSGFASFQNIHDLTDIGDDPIVFAD